MKAAQASTGGSDQDRQIATRQVKTFAQRLSLFAFKFDQPMRDAILIEEIIELMSIARIAAGQNTHSREFAIAAEPSPSHDQGIDDCLAHAREFPRARAGVPLRECGVSRPLPM